LDLTGVSALRDFLRKTPEMANEIIKIAKVICRGRRAHPADIKLVGWKASNHRQDGRGAANRFDFKASPYQNTFKKYDDLINLFWAN